MTIICNTCGIKFQEQELTSLYGLPGLDPGCPDCGGTDFSEPEEEDKGVKMSEVKVDLEEQP